MADTDRRILERTSIWQQAKIFLPQNADRSRSGMSLAWHGGDGGGGGEPVLDPNYSRLSINRLLLSQVGWAGGEAPRKRILGSKLAVEGGDGALICGQQWKIL